MVFLLTEELAFPDPHNGDPDGLLAVGGDLSVDRLLLAYSNGIFPWYAFRQGTIEWWCPLQRFVIFPSEIHISHSMRTLMNKNRYEITFNNAFDEVIRACGELRMKEEGAWLEETSLYRLTRTRIRRQCRSLGRSIACRRTIRSYTGTMLLRREHVFTGSQCLKTCPDSFGTIL